MPRPLPNEERDVLSEIYRRLNAVESYANDIARHVINFDSPKPLSRVDPITYENPYEGQRAIDPADEQHMWYSDGMWRKASGPALFEIKVTEDDEVVTVDDWKWDIPEDLDDAVLLKAEIWVTTVSSSGTITVQLRNNTQSVDMLSTVLSIDVGEKNSRYAATQHVVNTANAAVNWADEIWVRVTNAGSGAKGLGINLYFSNAAIGTVTVQGAQGPAGGVTSFQGAWTTATAYQAGDVVTNGGVAYVAIIDHTSAATTEPGVGATWQTAWMPMADVPMSAGIVFSMQSNSVIATGVKGMLPEMPFDATITKATLLADVAGNATLDIWKSTYASYPPTSANSIVGTPLSLTGATKNQDSTLSGWTTSLTAGDILVFYVSGVTVISRLALALKLAK